MAVLWSFPSQFLPFIHGVCVYGMENNRRASLYIWKHITNGFTSTQPPHSNLLALNDYIQDLEFLVLDRGFGNGDGQQTGEPFAVRENWSFSRSDTGADTEVDCLVCVGEVLGDGVGN